MKSATLPSLRVQPQLRDAANSVLQEGETLSAFMETAIRDAISLRQSRAAFFERGLATRSGEVQAAGSVNVEEVMGELQRQQRQVAKRVRGEA